MDPARPNARCSVQSKFRTPTVGTNRIGVFLVASVTKFNKVVSCHVPPRLATSFQVDSCHVRSGPVGQKIYKEGSSSLATPRPVKSGLVLSSQVESGHVKNLSEHQVVSCRAMPSLFPPCQIWSCPVKSHRAERLLESLVAPRLVLSRPVKSSQVKSSPVLSLTHKCQYR